MSESSEQLPVTSEDGLQSSDPNPQEEPSQVSQKTQCVKPPRDNGVGVLQSAAKKAARTNSRSDVHEYMRIRRSFV